MLQEATDEPQPESEERNIGGVVPGGDPAGVAMLANSMISLSNIFYNTRCEYGWWGPSDIILTC